MQKRFRDVTDAELAVLHSLWKRGRSTIRELADELYPGGMVSEYATVKKLLERLEFKGCVVRDRTESVHIFQAAIGREDLVGHRLRALADSLCNGSLTPLLTHLVGSPRLTKDELRSLRALVDELQLQSEAKGKP